MVWILVILMVYEIKSVGKHRGFESGAQRDSKAGKGRYDLLFWRVIHALAIHFQKGAEKYSARNWEKGMPVSEFLDSGGRHYAQLMMGENDENHLVSALWNLGCAYETIMRIQDGTLPKELWDMPFDMPEL